MRDKILIAAIIILAMTAIGIGIYVAIVPTKVPTPPPVLTHEELFPKNTIPGLVGVNKPNKKIERLFAIKNYPKNIISEDINKIDRLRYYVLNEEAKGHLLVLPFATGGKITLSKVYFDEGFNEEFMVGNVIFEEEITPGYALLLKYDRTDKPELEIKITENEKVASVWITNEGDGSDAIQFIKVNSETSDVSETSIGLIEPDENNDISELPVVQEDNN